MLQRWYELVFHGNSLVKSRCVCNLCLSNSSLEGYIALIFLLKLVTSVWWEKHQIPAERHPTRSLTMLLKTVKVPRTEESLRNCRTPEEGILEGTWNSKKTLGRSKDTWINHVFYLFKNLLIYSFIHGNRYTILV